MKISLKNARILATGDHEEVSVAGNWPNTLILKGGDAEQFRKEYLEQLRNAELGSFNMELQIDVEFEEPAGAILRRA
jgi:hypothetical protein